MREKCREVEVRDSGQIEIRSQSEYFPQNVTNMKIKLFDFLLENWLPHALKGRNITERASLHLDLLHLKWLWLPTKCLSYWSRVLQWLYALNKSGLLTRLYLPHRWYLAEDELPEELAPVGTRYNLGWGYLLSRDLVHKVAGGWFSYPR